jgi:hypothetical protein
VSTAAVWDPHPLSRFNASMLWHILLLSALYHLWQSILRGCIWGCVLNAGLPAFDASVSSPHKQQRSSKATGGACQLSGCGIWVCYGLCLNMFINTSANIMICIK